jgi:hypothetical protein
MRDLVSLPAERLLKISAPENLFSQSLLEAKREYRALAFRWHPDREKSKVAPAVFAHVASLYQAARRGLFDGSWVEPCEKVEVEVPGMKAFRLTDGSVRRFRHHRMRRFELGIMFINDHAVLFEVGHHFRDLFLNACASIESLAFSNEKMAAEMSPSLPQITDLFETRTSSVLVLRKTPDQLLLADALAHCEGRLMPIEHVGWILNVLLNLCCYLEWAGITHNAICPETFFVSPLRHSGMLLGGWWYAVGTGKQLIALPETSLQFIPEDIVRNKRGDCRADLELVKSIGRTVLGDPGGAHLQFDSNLSPALINWLRLPTSGKAMRDYSAWKHNVLPAAFGRPKFVRMNLSSLDLYKEI